MKTLVTFCALVCVSSTILMGTAANAFELDSDTAEYAPKCFNYAILQSLPNAIVDWTAEDRENVRIAIIASTCNPYQKQEVYRLFGIL